MPKPLKNEPKAKYLQRCMSDVEMKTKHKDDKERYAVCQAFYVEYATDEYQNQNFWNENRNDTNK